MNLKKPLLTAIAVIITLLTVVSIYHLAKSPVEIRKDKPFGETLREQRANSKEKLERFRNHGERNNEGLKRWGM